jgi:hypothetical protein
MGQTTTKLETDTAGRHEKFVTKKHIHENKKTSLNMFVLFKINCCHWNALQFLNTNKKAILTDRSRNSSVNIVTEKL